MYVNALKINIDTTAGEYGFYCTFGNGLNIIRGNNSSGKSTLLNVLLYSLGMEEIIGGRGLKALPYTLTSHLLDGQDRHEIINSSVDIEVQNRQGKVLTFRRSIKSDEKSHKLVEVIDGSYLTNNETQFSSKPTYLHDKGSAQRENIGFFKVLEEFLGLDLPEVPGTQTKEIKLYLQTLFSAFFVEQKRGWTDYIANTPYFGIRNVKNKVIEFLLDLEVFENDRRRNELNIELAEINQKWESEKYKIKLVKDRHNLTISGIASKPTVDFDKNIISIYKISGSSELKLSQYVSELISRIEAIKTKQHEGLRTAPEGVVVKVEMTVSKISRLTSLYESLVSERQLNKTLIGEYEANKENLSKDLDDNKTAKKLRDMGGTYQLKVADDKCPTCHQPVDDSLLLADTHVQPMNIDQNITYLDKQIRMLDKYILGIKSTIEKQNRQLSQIKTNITENQATIIALKKDISSYNEVSEAELRQQIRIEDDLSQIDNIEDEVAELIEALVALSAEFKENKLSRATLPKSYLSGSDRAKLAKLQETFKRLAKKFGYRSANTDEIKINDETFLPFLSDILLREVAPEKPEESTGHSSKDDKDIKADSSASDFVRLIWAYLLSIYEASESKGGNHIGLIAFDEPGQHSMASTSMKELFKTFNDYPKLQAIVAASFNENESEFDKETEGTDFHLIKVGDKLIKKLTA